MAYSPYYNAPGGPFWVDGDGGGTPQVASALINMENGILAALVAPGSPVTNGVVSYNGTTYSTIQITDAMISSVAAISLAKLTTAAASRGQMIVMGASAFAPGNTLQAAADGTIPLVVKQNSATQSADLFEAVDSTGTVMFAVQKDGTVRYKDGTLSTNAGGSRLDKVSSTSNSSTISATTEGTAVAVLTGTSQAYTATENQIEFWCSSITTTVTPTIHVVVKRGATIVGHQTFAPGTVTNGPYPFLSVYDTPTASTFAYSISAFVSAGNVIFNAGAGGSGNVLPMTMRVSRA